MKQWTDVRRKVLVEGMSKAQVKREHRLSSATLEKMLAHSSPPGYRMNKPRLKPKIGPFIGRIEEILKQDKLVPKKQRHTAKRIFDRLQKEGYSGGYTQVKETERQVIRGGSFYLAIGLMVWDVADHARLRRENEPVLRSALNGYLDELEMYILHNGDVGIIRKETGGGGRGPQVGGSAASALG
jgi:hypothetical protein